MINLVEEITDLSGSESFVDDYYVTEVINKNLPKYRYLDRELSWLAFNQRVLELAKDEQIPLLERLNFLAIFASNLDEFFMVRVAGLKSRIQAGIAVPTQPDVSPSDALTELNAKAYELMRHHSEIWRDISAGALADEKIEIVRWAGLNQAQQEELSEYFHAQLYPVLMPLAVDPAHPFPYISGLSLNLSIQVKNPKNGKEQFARLKVPQMFARFKQIESEDGISRFVALEEIIAEHLEELFPGMEILNHSLFRVTRNEDLQVDGHDTDNLIKALEKELMRRRFGPPIRLEVSTDTDQETLDFLVNELKITEQEVYRLPEPLDLTGLYELARIDRPELHYPVHVPTTNYHFKHNRLMQKPDIFANIAREEVLVHHPYESFSTSVQAFLEQAATDPQVLAIKQTLYRTSGDSPIVEALIDAANAGKQVLALVEVQARFDEQANISWARKLEQAGVHVVYGLVGLKTHCKLALVIRAEDNELKHYSHIGTGNYNPKTSRIYEDLGLFTADPQVGRELTRLFNELSGYAIEKKFRRLLVAPMHMRKGLLKHIKREIDNAQEGKPSGIRIKVNSIVDEQIIDGLYLASQAGVPVDIWVRGICAVKP
ncbi:MAG: polyphosphate kinase 1, partial [Microbacteriaceae bacterium]